MMRQLLLTTLLTLSALAQPWDTTLSEKQRPVGKVLFLGNSITRHGPLAKIGWMSDWGMAASAKEKDYVHLVASSLTKSTGATPEVMIKNVAGFERHHTTYDLEENLKDALEFDADLIIVAIGENVPRLNSDKSKAQFAKSFGQLLSRLKDGHNPILLVRSCFRANSAKDKILRQGCRDAGGIFADIGKLGKDEENYARSERKSAHMGVAAHPGDKGMQAIAQAILKAIPGSILRSRDLGQTPQPTNRTRDTEP